MPPKAKATGKREAPTSTTGRGTSKRHATRSQGSDDDLNEETPDQVLRCGAVTLDVTTLTATITAAISRGLRDAGLPSLAQQSTKENAEDVVLKDSVDLTLGEGNQAKPSSTLFTSATVSGRFAEIRRGRAGYSFDGW